MKKDQEFWKNNLTSHQYKVCRTSGTERAFTGKYNKYYEEGSILLL